MNGSRPITQNDIDLLADDHQLVSEPMDDPTWGEVMFAAFLGVAVVLGLLVMGAVI